MALRAAGTSPAPQGRFDDCLRHSTVVSWPIIAFNDILVSDPVRQSVHPTGPERVVDESLPCAHRGYDTVAVSNGDTYSGRLYG